MKHYYYFSLCESVCVWIHMCVLVHTNMYANVWRPEISTRYLSRSPPTYCLRWCLSSNLELSDLNRLTDQQVSGILLNLFPNTRFIGMIQHAHLFSGCWGSEVRSLLLHSELFTDLNHLLCHDFSYFILLKLQYKMWLPFSQRWEYKQADEQTLFLRFGQTPFILCIPGTLGFTGDGIWLWFYSHHKRVSICIPVSRSWRWKNDEHEIGT